MEANSTPTPCHIDAIYQQLGLLCGVVLSTLCVGGIGGNLLSLYVFSRSHYRSNPINVLLCALSIADCLLLTLAIPVFALPPYWTFLCEAEFEFFDTAYKLSFLYFYPLTLMCQCASVWILVCVSIEQWLVIRWSQMVERYFSRRCALWIILCTSISAVLYNLSAFWENHITEDGTVGPLLRNLSSYALWKNTVGDFGLTFVIPLSTLGVSNFLVYRQIVQAQKAKFKLSSEAMAAHRMARMLLYVVLMFIVCYTMSLVLILFELFQPDWFYSQAGMAVSDLNNILAVLNSSTSCLFYLRYSSRYRRTVVQLFRSIRYSYQPESIPLFSAHTLNDSNTLTAMPNALTYFSHVPEPESPDLMPPPKRRLKKTTSFRFNSFIVRSQGIPARKRSMSMKLKKNSWDEDEMVHL